MKKREKLIGEAQQLIGRLEVCFGFNRVGYHGFCTGFPIGRTHLTVCVRILECLYQTQGFVDTSTYRQIIYGNLSQLLITVNNKQTTKCYASFFIQHIVTTTNVHRFIGQQWDVHGAQATILARRIYPCQMRKMAVGRTGNQFTVNVPEFLSPVRKCNNFRWTNKCTAKKKGKNLKKKCKENLNNKNLQVQWIKEQNYIFALVIVQRDFLDFTIDNGHTTKCWCQLLNLQCHICLKQEFRGFLN